MKPCPGSVAVRQNHDRARFAYDDLLLLFTCSQEARSAADPYPTSLTCSGGALPAWLRHRKYPSSYPDFRIRPFCTTTLNRPVKRSTCNNRSRDADSTSAPCTLRRNSTNACSSLGASTVFIGFCSHKRS